MANGKQSEVRRLRMAERAEKQRLLYFPGVSDDVLWHRKRNDGYTTLPRVMPIVMEGIDGLEKNHAAGHVYFCLWCRAPDHPLLVIDNPMTFAAEAGYRGDRAGDTWRRRMRVLRDAGFILAKQGPSGEFHYVLLLNPTQVMVRLHAQGRVQDAVHAKLVDRSMEVGSYGEIETATTAIVPPPAPPVAAIVPPAPLMPTPPRGPMPMPPSALVGAGGAPSPVNRPAPPPPAASARKAPPPPPRAVSPGRAPSAPVRKVKGQGGKTKV